MNKFLRYFIVGGALATLFLPLLISDSIFFPFISGKNFLFRIIVELMLAAWVLLMLRMPEYRPRSSLISRALILFITILTLADIFAMNPYKAFWSNFERMEGLIGFLHLLGYFFVVSSVIRTEKLWGILFHTSIGVSLFTCLYASLQIGGELAINQGGVRVDATFGNAIYLAVYLLFHIFLVKKRVYGPKEIFKSVMLGSAMFLIYYLVRVSSSSIEAHRIGVILSLSSLAALLLSGYALQTSKERVLKLLRIVFEWLLIIFYVVVIFYTATRGVIVGLGASLIVLAVLLLLAPENESRRVYRKIGGGILLLIILAGASFFMFRDVPAIRNHHVFGRLASVSITGDDATARYRVWGMAFEGFKERPILGWGQEGFNYVFNKYYDPKMYAREQWFDRTHDVFLDWLIAGGIFGLLSYLFIYFALLRRVWKAPRGTPEDREAYTLSYVEKVVLTAVVTGYFIQNFFVFDNLTSYIVFFILLSYVHFVTTSRLRVAERVSEFNTVTHQLVPALTVVLLVFALYFFNVKPIMAGQTLIAALQQYPMTQNGEGGPAKNLELFKKALSYNTFAASEIREQLAQVATTIFQAKDAPESLKTAYFEVGYNELKAQLEQTPEDARYHLFMGVFLNAAGQYQEGVSYLEKALSFSPTKQTIMFELGTSYLNGGDYEKALAVFKKAFELEPAFNDARIIYALGAVYANKQDLADSILIDGFGTTLVNDSRLMQAYANKKQFPRLIEIYKNLLEKQPNNTDLHLRLAGAYYQNGQRALAIAQIRKVIEIDPNLKEQGEQSIKEIQEGK